MNEKQLKKLLNTIINVNGADENPVTEDMVTNENVHMVVNNYGTNAVKCSYFMKKLTDDKDNKVTNKNEFEYVDNCDINVDYEPNPDNFKTTEDEPSGN